MPIENQIAAYQAALTETANAEFNNLQAITDYQDVFDRVLDVLDREYPDIAQRLAEVNTRKTAAALKLKDAKTAEVEAKAALSQTAFDAAVAENNKTGRWLHPNVNIAVTSSVTFHKLYQATQWLLDNGKLEDITLKASKPAWYRDHKTRGTLPEDAITVLEIPLVRIDSTWNE